MKSKNITFKNRDGISLSARIDEPDSGEIRSTLLFAHCFTCGKNLKALGHISRAITDLGIGMFRFDFTGLGQSDGDFADSTFSSDVQDLVAAAEFMDENWVAPTILMGHSLGGAAVLQAASKIKSSKAICTIGSPCNPQHVQHLISGSMDKILEKGMAEVNLAGRKFNIKKAFIDDLNEQRMDNLIKNLNKALLIFHSPVDETVSIDNAAHIYKLARHPKSFVSLDNADHLLTKAEDSEYTGKVAAAWAERYFFHTD